MTKMDWERRNRDDKARGSAGDTYVGVTVILHRRTAKAVQVSPESDLSVTAWIPRSCLHGADDSVIDALALPDEVSIRIFQWIADREGLI